MVDIGFKNSSNSDRNEGPTPPPWSGGGRTVVPPPPDWNQVVVDGPPPPPFFNVPGFPMCFESTFTLLAIKVSKDGSWSVDYPENEPFPLSLSTDDLDTLKEAGIEIDNPGIRDLWKTFLINMRRAAPGSKTKFGANLCHIIKKCICVEDWAVALVIQGNYERQRRRKKTHWSKGFRPKSDSDGDWWMYLDYTLEPVCKDCPDSKTCPCVGSKQIDLTDKIKSGPPTPPSIGRNLLGLTHTSIYTDSGGHEHSIPHGGGDESFKEVIKKILEIEDELFDCTK